MSFTLDTATLVIIVGVAGIVFNAGINWAYIRQLRKDINGFKNWADAHEKWSQEQVRAFSDRVARLEPKG